MVNKNFSCCKSNQQWVKRVFCGLFLICFCSILIFPGDHLIRNNKTSFAQNSRKLQDTAAEGQFVVEWTLSLGGKEFLLESPFLKAGLEQSIKDFINNDIICSNPSGPGTSNFYGVEISSVLTVDSRIDMRRIEGNGKCKGDPTKCKRVIKDTAAKAAERKRRHLEQQIGKTDDNKNFCDDWKGTAIFDVFQKILVTASAFNYAIDVDVIADLEGALDLSYDVSFQPAPSDGLDQVESVDMESSEPIPVDTQCSESQCITQREIMRKLFVHFQMNFDDSKHECLHDGVNCNSDDLVKYIWIEPNNSSTYTIPELFGFLPSLSGLFLGASHIVGTIPSSFGSLRKLKMLWIQDNALTGTIPTQLGNVRGLLQLNLYNNALTGTIPSELGKMTDLQLLNLARNELTGTMPMLSIEKKDVDGGPSDDCSSFPNPFIKIGISWVQQQQKTDKEPFGSIKTLSLHDNHLTGVITPGIATFVDMVDLNLAANEYSGELPTEFGDLRNLAIMDVHDNQFSGTIPWEIGKSPKLTVLNLYNNRFEKTIPTHIGKLTELTELTLDNNKLTGPIPTELGNLRNLEYLSFAGNRMRGEIPSELGNLESLSNIDFRDYIVETTVEGGKRASGTIPTELGKLTGWKYLIFLNNGVEGAVPTELGNCQSASILWLQNQKVTGGIPSELGQLSSLLSLSLGSSSMSGTIPPELGNLTQLSVLGIGGNNLSGILPTELANIATLTFMGLDNINISGSIPTEYQHLSSLQILSLAGNSLTGSIPSGFGQLTSLQSISVGGNTITGTIPIEMGNLSQMQILSLGPNIIEGPIPTELGNLQQLKSLGLASTSLTGTIPTELGSIQSLESLDVGNNQVTGSIPSELGSIPGLSEIGLGNNQITGTMPTSFGQLRELRSLALGPNNLVGPIPSELGQCTALAILGLGGNELTGPIPTELGNIVTLGSLDIVGNALTGPIPSEFGALTMLSDVNLGGNSLTGSIPTGLQANLETLDISGNDITGDLWFMCDLQQVELEEDDLPDCSNYCGTADEECNSTSIGEAKCTDVGCSGSGVPSCTDKCRLDYSSCSAESDEISFHMDLQTDNRGWETTWEIRDEFNIVLESGGSYRNDASNIEFYCVKRGCYTFEIYDSGGDGICCGEGKGSYSLLVDGSKIPFTKPTFGSSKVHEIGTCTAAPFPSSVSMEPSASPTWWPSETPSEYPSLMPSGLSSSTPTLLPSEYPSLMPSGLSSSTPTLLPSEYPSLMPSGLPSIMHSDGPSEQSSVIPSGTPSFNPTSVSSVHPSEQPSLVPSISPAPSIDKFIELTRNNPASNARFGFKVVLSDDVVYASTPFENQVLKYDLAVRDLQVFFTGNDDVPGFDLAANSDTLLISAPNANIQKGKVHLVPKLQGTEEALIASDRATAGEQRYGTAADISEDAVVVGAPNADLGGVLRGAVYLYTGSPRTETKIEAPDARDNLRFGNKVKFGDDILFIGAPHQSEEGALYAYDLSGNHLFTLRGDDVSDNFGNEIDSIDNTLLVGAPRGLNPDQVDTGAVYVYTLVDNPGTSRRAVTDATLLTKLYSDDGESGDAFGGGVKSTSDQIYVCASQHDNQEGALYVFDRNFTQIEKMPSPIGNADKRFGIDVDASDTVLVVSSFKKIGSKDQAGAVHIIR